MMALDGLRVIDLAGEAPGAFCAMLLGDMGADVVHIESPRAPSPPALTRALDRSKRGLALDLTDAAGVDVLHRLARSADVVVATDPPGREPRGADPATLAALNPRLIYAAVTDFGRAGPYAGRRGGDLVAQGVSGIMSATGSGGVPVAVGVPIAELGAGLFAVVGVLAAVRARHRTGRGQLVDTSPFDAAVALSQWEATQYWYTGEVPRGLGTAHRLNAPYQAFRASDGYFTVGAANDNLWPRFATLLGLAHLVADSRFDTVPGRVRHRAELEALIEQVTCKEPRAHWLAACESIGVPAGPIYSVPEALTDPHAMARGMVQTLTDPELGPVHAVGNPVKMSATPPHPRPTPTRGGDTDAILRELGYDDAAIAALRGRRVI
jgi:formyl-CoA transferase